MEYALLQWKEDGTPVSVAHGDVYFSREGARAETELVFLEGNQLPARWQGRTRFTIAETGFGTGLNFLHALARFEEMAPTDAKLHYISVEKTPLHPGDLARAHALWPELADASAALRAEYPMPVAGWHRIHLPRATLTLGFGDATELLQGIDAQIDAWFLDGFAPAKNGDMWHEALMADIARLSAPGATIASFTAAGAVRRALEAVGFTIERRAGYGNKRHRIAGRYTPSLTDTSHSRDRGDTPCGGGALPKGQEEGGATVRSVPSCWREAQTTQPLLILGAGIAGASIAAALARRGMASTVLDAASECATGASGNRAGVLYPQITKQEGLTSRFTVSAYAYTKRLLAQYGSAHASPGMLKTPKDAKDDARLRGVNDTLGWHPDVARYLEADEASARMGVPLATGGVWFAQGTWLDPRALVRAMLAHPLIATRYNESAQALERIDGGWRVTTTAGRYDATYVILANAQDAARLVPAMKMGISAGQVSYVPAAQAGGALHAILCHKGYIVPQGDTYLIGATYDHHDHSGAVTAENHQKNYAEAEAALPGWLEKGTQNWQGRTSLRATTANRMPYIGALEEGLYASVGHGSRGLLSGPLGGECIASMIAGETVPLARDIREALCPKRRQGQ